MTNEKRRHGKTTIAPEVLITIARLSALGVDGVARLVPAPGRVDALFQRGAREGVQLRVKNNSVAVDLHVALYHDASAHDVSRAVQTEVARAIEDMVGMDIEYVNVHIDDIDFGQPEAAEA